METDGSPINNPACSVQVYTVSVRLLKCLFENKEFLVKCLASCLTSAKVNGDFIIRSYVLTTEKYDDSFCS